VSQPFAMCQQQFSREIKKENERREREEVAFIRPPVGLYTRGYMP